MNNSQNRDVRAKVALETLKILESGFYTNHQGATIETNRGHLSTFSYLKYYNIKKA